MDIKKVETAIEEAKRFIEKAKAFVSVSTAKGVQQWEIFPRESGACRRSSMDLTRALAEMRRV